MIKADEARDPTGREIVSSYLFCQQRHILDKRTMACDVHRRLRCCLLKVMPSVSFTFVIIVIFLDEHL